MFIPRAQQTVKDRIRQHNTEALAYVKKNKQSDSYAKHFGDLWNKIDKVPAAGLQRGMASYL